MGIIPTPEIYQGVCNQCFGVGTTPKIMKLCFGGIKMGGIPPGFVPPPPQGYFDGENSVPLPCIWGGGNPAAVHWALSHRGGDSRIQLQFGVVTSYFLGIDVNPCTRYFVNSQQNPAQNYYGGWAYAATPAQMAEWIELATPIVGPDPRMELFPMEDNQIVVRFANIQDGTNIEIKFDTTAL